jgi:hypothetical protein
MATFPGTIIQRTAVNRIYLYVPPEENAEVKALGARRDLSKMCWYLDTDQDIGPFAKWLPDAGGDELFGITSDRAFVASAMQECWSCGESVEVICIFCETGVASEQDLENFTVSYIASMDDSLQAQLKPWVNFRLDEAQRLFANHCPECGMTLDDGELHSEPGQPFMDLLLGKPDVAKLIPLVGLVRMNGEEGFGF